MSIHDLVPSSTLLFLSVFSGGYSICERPNDNLHNPINITHAFHFFFFQPHTLNKTNL